MVLGVREAKGHALSVALPSVSFRLFWATEQEEEEERIEGRGCKITCKALVVVSERERGKDGGNGTGPRRTSPSAWLGQAR